MSPANSVAMRPFGSIPFSAGQTRVLNAALALFAEHGVGGTSIRMIADAIGVTKAAIYFHFKTKDEIVLAAAGLGFAKLEWALEAAEADESPSRAREFLIRQVIEISLEQRHVTRALQHDPVMLRLLMEHEPFQRMFERMQRVDDRRDAPIPRRGCRWRCSREPSPPERRIRWSRTWMMTRSDSHLLNLARLFLARLEPVDGQ